MSIEQFAALHRKGDPLILYNVWDAGSAIAVANAGAKAIATGSASLAGAQGYGDGQEIPFEGLLATTRQIAGCIDLPLSVDFEAGFAQTPDALAANASALRQAGAIGCNFEDRIIGGEGLVGLADQSARITAIADAGLFVNARTDTFLGPLMAGDDPNQSVLVEQALARGKAYHKAGAGCFFIPGLSNPEMIAQVVDGVDMPVNVMRLPDMVPNSELAKLGTARISYGPGSWSAAMAGVEAAAREALVL